MEERNYTVYKHTSPNGKVYIGITGLKIKKRWQNGNGYKNNKHFTNAIQKYGWDGFTHEIVATGLTQEEAERMEVKLIAKYKKEGITLYNIENGGNSIGKHSEETKNKISKKNKEENHPMAKKVYCGGLIFNYVKICSFFYNQNHITMTKWLNSNSPMPQEYIDLGLRYATQEDIEIYPTYDKEVHGEKINIKIYIGKKKRIFFNGLIFTSLSECSVYCGKHKTTICAWLKGNRKMPQQYKDLGLRYATEEDILNYPTYNKNIK